ncbi:MAG: porin, partial [Thiovulaceae bacterium]|nr:porin [Sulfurimonadaceae bacterium]
MKKTVLALSVAAVLANVAYADTASELQTLKQQVAALQANQEALVDETSNANVGFTTVDTAFSHNGMGPAASKVYRSSSPLSIGGYGDMYFADSDKKGADNIADVYRFVPYIGYKFTDNIILNTEIEFEHGGANPEMDEPEGYAIVEFMYLDFLLDQAFNVQLGHLLVPMGLIGLRHEPTLYNTVQKPKTEKYI